MPFPDVPPAFDWPLQFCVLTAVATFVVSVLTGNVSQVDRLWTFLPTIYTAYYALLPLWPSNQAAPFLPFTPASLGRTIATSYSPRALLMLSLVFIWMCRLTYNAYRRGLFNFKEEDYRWDVLRAQIPSWLFQVINLTFISGIQSVILLSLGFPAQTAATLQPHTPLVTSDILLALAALVTLAVEFTADNQQYAFQSYKQSVLGGKVKYAANEQWPGARLAWTLEDAKRGFVTKGLWRYSRHPNVACEQTFWWIITMLPIFAPFPPSLPSGFFPMFLNDALNALQHPSLIPYYIRTYLALLSPLWIFCAPALSLSLLLISSTNYTEAITLSKYTDAYAAYKTRVGMFGPFRTFEKWVMFSLFTNEKRKKAVKALVWGNPDKVVKRE